MHLKVTDKGLFCKNQKAILNLRSSFNFTFLMYQLCEVIVMFGHHPRPAFDNNMCNPSDRIICDVTPEITIGDACSITGIGAVFLCAIFAVTSMSELQ